MRKILLLSAILIQQFGFAQKSQNIEMETIETKRYPVYKNITKNYDKPFFQKATKTWPVQTFKEGTIYPKILIKKVGILDEFYKADLPNFPAYYHGDKTIVVSVLSGKIYYYEWSAAKGATIKYVLTDKKIGSYVSEKETIDNYRRTIKGKQTGTRDVRIKNTAIAKAKEEKENSLKGKSIKSIKVKIVNKDAKLGMFSVINIGMEVTLANGTVLKTKNLGGKTPYSDFDSKVSGGAFAGGDFKVSNNANEIVNDKIEVEVWSKFGGQIKGRLVQPLNYKTDVFYYFKGGGGSYGRTSSSGNGGNGKNARSVSVTATKLSINNETVIKLTVRDANTGKHLSNAKINIANTLTINVEGGDGGHGGDGSSTGGNGGNGGNGGTGGNITITGSGASIINLIANNNGGNGGNGGRGKSSAYRSGSGGRAGSNGRLSK